MTATTAGLEESLVAALAPALPTADAVVAEPLVGTPEVPVGAVAVAATEALLLSAGPARLDGVRVIGVEPAGEGLSGGYNVKELFAEIDVPLLADLPFIRQLETNLGYRVSDYDTIGQVASYKADLSWEAIDGLRLRGGVQRAVRAPSSSMPACAT